MSKTFGHYEALLRALDFAREEIPLPLGSCEQAFTILCKLLEGETCNPEDFPALWQNVAQQIEHMAEVELNANGQTDRYNHLSLEKSYFLNNAREFIIALYGDENDPECIRAVELTLSDLENAG